MNTITRKPLTKRIGIFALLVAMLLTLSAPMASFAAPTVPAGTDKGSITIHKLARGDGSSAPADANGTVVNPLPAGTTGLNGAEFTIVRVEADPNGTYTVDGQNYKAASPGYTDTQTTAKVGNDDGIIQWTDLPFGLYYVKETKAVNGYTESAPFIVAIPTTVQGENGEDSLIYDVNVYPKAENIEIDKGAVAHGGDASDAEKNLPAAIGDTIDWYITSNVPQDFVGNDPDTEYAVVDNYSAGLHFNDVVVVKNKTTGTTLATGDYTVAKAGIGGTGSELGTGGGRVTITLTSSGLAKLNPGDQLEVKIETVLLASAAIGTNVNNEAELDYTNSSDVNFNAKTDPDNPSNVYTGGLSYYKVTPEMTALSGAAFKLVERTKNATSQADYKTDFDKNGYYRLPDQNSDLTATSNDSGYFEFKGIPYGEAGDPAATAEGYYWLVETDAPNGYRLYGEAIPVVITKDSYNTGYQISDAIAQGGRSVVDQEGFEFPLTGGMGTLIFVVGGIVLIGLAGIVIVSSRRKGRKPESVQ